MKKIIITILIFNFLPLEVLAINTDDIKMPQPQYERLGIQNKPERKFEVVDANTKSQAKVAKIVNEKNNLEYNHFTYADLSLKKLAKEISEDLDFEREDIVEDVKTLWVGAANQSETISYAMYKLSNPDAEKPNQNLVKKILKPIASLSSVAGMGISDPFMATSAIISGNIVGAVTSDNNTVNYKYSKVTDADMVILVRKIDDLQKDLTNKYCEYILSRRILKMSIELTKKRRDRCARMENRSREEILIADAYYRDALNQENRYRVAFLSKRAALEQLVGNKILSQFEQTLVDREKNN